MMHNIPIRLLAVEGIDQVLIGELRHPIVEAVDYQVVSVNRFTVSMRVLDRICSRRDSEEHRRLRNVERELARTMGLMVIFIDTSPSECYERSVKEGNPRYTVAELAAQRQLFLEELPRGDIPVLTVKSEGRAIGDIAKECATWIKALG